MNTYMIRLSNIHLEDEWGGFNNVAVNDYNANGSLVFMKIKVHGFFFFKKICNFLLQIIDALTI
jgi:hypothetical protein